MISTNRAGQPWVEPGDDSEVRVTLSEKTL